MKGVPVTATHSYHPGGADEGFLMFDQTSDMGNGIHYGAKSNGNASQQRREVPQALMAQNAPLPVQVHQVNDTPPVDNSQNVVADATNQQKVELAMADTAGQNVTPDQLSPVNVADDEPMPAHISPSPPQKEQTA